jgi:signal transduction histidine kinase
MNRNVDILLLDDSVLDAELLRGHLEGIHSLNCKLDWESHPEKALELAAQNCYDVYLIDHNLGGITGLDFIRRAVQIGCLRPMVLYTGMLDMNLGVQAVNEGASDYLVKDYLEPFLLEKTLWNVMERDRMTKENQIMQMRLYESQRLESLGLMAGGVAHDFNNLLGVMSANLDLMEMTTGLSEEHTRYIEQIHTTVQRASELAGQMLAFSGRGGVKREFVDPAKLFMEITELVRSWVPRRIALEMGFPKELGMVLGDPTQLRQIILNLLSNSADSIEGDGIIQISGCVTEAIPAQMAHPGFPIPMHPGRYIKFSVQDSGCGMDTETVKRIFDPFFTTKLKGRGLGMAAVMGILRGHDGAISVLSTPGQGTVMEIYLPYHQTSELKPSPIKAPQPLIKNHVKRVLVVEDEPELMAAIAMFLKTMGLEIQTAGSFDGAVTLLKESKLPLDAALLDLTLPGKSGMALYRELSKAHPNIKVVFMSGYSEDQDIDTLVERQEARFLKKPFAFKSLYTALTAANPPH